MTQKRFGVSTISPSLARLGALALGMALLAGSGSDVAAKPKDALVLICRVEGAGLLEKGFEAAFCREFATYLKQDLGLSVSRSKGGSGRALEVRLSVRTRSAGTVSMRAGRIENGKFSGGEATEATLNSMDSPLTPLSARTLVRPAGVLLGLV